MATIITLLLVATVVGVGALKPINVDSGEANSNSQLCLQRVNQLDQCLPKLVVYGDRKFDAPKTEQQLDQHCHSLDDNLKCFAKRCKSKEGRKDFINLMACADAQYMEPSHKCMDAFVAHLEHIGKGSQTRQIELTCCTFQLFQDCIFTESKRIDCPHRKVSAEKSIEYVRSIINSMGGDVMDFMCGKYDKVSACDAGHPSMMSQFRAITGKIQNGTMKAQASSPLKPMLQLFINSQGDE